MKMNRVELALSERRRRVMLRLSWILLILAAVAGVAGVAAVTCGAEPPLIDAPDKIEAYKIVDAKLTGAWEQAIWEIVPAANVDSRFAPDGKSVIFVAPAGSYTLDAVVINFTTKKFARGKKIVVIGQPGPNPNPDPGPDPNPNPNPLPVPTTLWGIVVEETHQRTPAQAAVILSPKVAALFAPSGGKLRIVDGWDADGKVKTNLNASDLPYVTRSDALKVRPLLVIVDPKGTVYFERLLPGKVADVEAVVGKIRKGEKP